MENMVEICYTVLATLSDTDHVEHMRKTIYIKEKEFNFNNIRELKKYLRDAAELPYSYYTHGNIYIDILFVGTGNIPEKLRILALEIDELKDKYNKLNKIETIANQVNWEE